MPLKDTDKGYTKVLERINMLQGVGIGVGITEASGAVPKISNSGEVSSLTVYDVAAANEFGLGVTQRSFVAGWFDQNFQKNQTLISKAVTRIIWSNASLFAAVSGLGMRLKNSMKKRIKEHGQGQYPGNTEGTIAKKHSDIPLIETGQLYDAINYEITVPGSGTTQGIDDGTD